MEYVFDLSGGDLSLDFVNTVDKRGLPEAQEHLDAYADLLVWGRQAGVLAPELARGLRREAERSPGAAQRVFRRAMTLREALYRILSSSAAGRSAPAADLDVLNAEAAPAAARLRLAASGKGFAWTWPEEPELDRVLWPVLRAATDLLASPRLESLRECAAGDCTWLFLDNSKNGARRWCSMQACGNRAKARRHYQRVRQEDGA